MSEQSGAGPFDRSVPGNDQDREVAAATRERLRKLLQRVGFPAEVAVAIGEDLHGRYSESHRHYHTLDHVDLMLSEFDSIPAESDAIELAIWFHDVVYDPRAHDNETRSAELFTTLAKPFVDEGIAEDVHRLIVATDPRRSRSARSDEDLIIDLDLRILATSMSQYDDYRRAVRKEYHFVDDRSFIIGRSAILNRFLQQPVFSTSFFRPFEVRARENLERELTLLVESIQY